MSKSILIVDDDDDDLEFFCEALKEVDGEALCLSCSGGYEALDMLQHQDSIIPDYIFMDQNMPRMTGRQCLLEIKKIVKLNGVQLIMYTTTRLTDEIRETKKIGVHFISKPNSFVALRQMISEVFNENWAEVDLLYK